MRWPARNATRCRPRTEEASAAGDPQETQDLPTWALQDVVSGIVTEAPQGNPAPGRVLAHRDHRVDAETLKPAVDPGVGITGIGRHRFDLATGDRPNLIDLSLDRLALAYRSGRHQHVQHHASRVVDCRVLLVAGLKPPVLCRGRHARVRIGPAHLPGLAAPPTSLRPGLNLPINGVRRHHIIRMTLDKALPAGIGAYEGGIDVHYLGRGDLRIQTGRDRTLENPPEPCLAQALADPRQARMVRQTLVQPVADESPDRDVDLSLANVFLHYVLDLWFHKKWRPNVPDGEAIIVRYADDIVVGFQHKRDAERYLRDVRERLARFGLSLHQDKTRLVEFGRFADLNRRQRGVGKPETFDFLGLTHYCTTTRRGRFRLVLFGARVRRRSARQALDVARF